MLELQHISLHYEKEEALRNIDISVSCGEQLSIIGPSGCGKTSLLYAIAGLRTISSGNIERRFSLSDCGIMFQDDRLLPWLSVRENIELGCEKPGNDDTAEQTKLYFLLDLDRHLHKYPNQLSGGQRQRAALARMLIRRPKLMLLDEPFAALDEQNRERLQQELLAYLQQHNISMILVTHSIAEAVFLGNRIVIMKQAGIFQEMVNSSILRTEARDTVEFYKSVQLIRKRLKEAMEGNERVLR